MRLRDRKRRWAKPFAIMVRDLAATEALCRVGAAERRLLTGPARPIVLLEARRDPRPRLAPSVAAGNRRLGVYLPYTPLHHLLMAGMGRPIVLTSGNLTDEPLATDDDDALSRLAGLADGFLAHDREIRARYDDTVTRVVAGRESVVRRARGYAPEALRAPVQHPETAARRRRGAQAHVHPGARRPGARRAAQRRPRGPGDPPGIHRRPGPPVTPPRPRAGGRRPRPPPGVPVHEVRDRAVRAGPPHRGPAPPRARRLVCRRARDHRAVPGRRLRRPGDGRRRHAVGRRDPARRPPRLPPARALRTRPAARRRARRAAAVPHGPGLPVRRGGARRPPRRDRPPRRGRGRRGLPRAPRPPRGGARPDAGGTVPQRPRRPRRRGACSTPRPRCSGSGTSRSSRPRRRSTWSSRPAIAPRHRFRTRSPAATACSSTTRAPRSRR